MTEPNVPGETKLVWDPSFPEKLTMRYDTDCRSSMALALRDYFLGLHTNIKGRRLGFKQGYEHWADPEDESEFPSFCVYTEVEGLYDNSNFTPRGWKRIEGTDESWGLVCTDFSQQYMIDVWCSGIEERIAITKMMEDAFFPVDWMFGFRLEMPYFYNNRATFEPMGVNYIDNEGGAKTRIRKVQFRIMGLTTMIKVLKKPTAKIRTQVVIEE